MLKKSIYINILLLFICFQTNAQIGGTGVYSFLELSPSAKAASLGGSAISVKDNDLNLVPQNPSLLNKSMHNQIALSLVNYYAGIKYGYASYAKSFDKNRTGYIGIQFIDYGKFSERDNGGLETGEFKAGEYAFNIGYSKRIDSSFTFGAQIKPIISSLFSYFSLGIATDISINYTSDNKRFSSSLIAKNIGTQIITYTEGNYEPLPTDIQLGISHKLEHAPFRFSLLAHHLNKYDISYANINDPEIYIDQETGEEVLKEITHANKILRHLNIGVEFLPSKNFHLDFGYNFQRRLELAQYSKTGATGISWGFGMKISKFKVSYGRATYHLAGGTNHISICTTVEDVKSFKKKKKDKKKKDKKENK